MTQGRGQIDTALATSRSAIPVEQALVFCRYDGDLWHPDQISKTLREFVIASGLPRIRPMQDLRHTHATLLKTRRVPPDASLSKVRSYR